MRAFSFFVVFCVCFTLLGCGSDSGSGGATGNAPPVIVELSSDTSLCYLADFVTLTCEATDANGDELSYFWTTTYGTFPNGVVTHSSVGWRAPGSGLSPTDSLTAVIRVRVTDGEDTVWQSHEILILNGDLWKDTGEPFIDDPYMNGEYNHRYDEGEVWLDLPSSEGMNFPPSPDGQYNRPDGFFDEYELFTRYAVLDSGAEMRLPVLYSYANILEDFPTGEPEWLSYPGLPGGIPGYYSWIADTSTWIDRNGDGVFQEPRLN